MKYAPALFAVLSQWQAGAVRLKIGQTVQLGQNRSEFCTLDAALASAELKTANTGMTHFVCKHTYNGWLVISKKV